MLKYIVYIVLLLFVCPVQLLAEGRGHPQAVEDAKNGVVKIVADVVNVKGEVGQIAGTGFVVAPGWIVTNGHMVNPELYPDPKTPPEKRIKSTIGKPFVLDGGFSDGDLKQAIQVVPLHSRDLALLKVETLSKREPLKIFINPALGKEIRTPLEEGYTTFAIGFPSVSVNWSPAQLGKPGSKGGVDAMKEDWFKPTVTKGIIEKLTTDPDWGVKAFHDDETKPANIIQHGSAIHPGNSGGPLIDECGNVLGVNTQGIEEKSFYEAADVSELKAFLERNSIAYTTSDKCEPGVAATSESGNQSMPVTAASLVIPTWLLTGGGLVLVALVGFTVLFFVRKPKPANVTSHVAPLQGLMSFPAAPQLTHDSAPVYVLQGLGSLGHLRFPLSNEHVHIGYDEDLNDYAVPDRTVSRQHLSLRNKDAAWYAIALRTTNPTTLNGAVLEPNEMQRLSEGDVLELGEARFAFSKS